MCVKLTESDGAPPSQSEIRHHECVEVSEPTALQDSDFRYNSAGLPVGPARQRHTAKGKAKQQFSSENECLRWIAEHGNDKGHSVSLGIWAYPYHKQVLDTPDHSTSAVRGVTAISKQVCSSAPATRNDRTGTWRVAWKSLEKKERVKRYQRALVAFSNRVLKTHPGTFAEFARKQRALDAHQRPSIVPKRPAKNLAAALPRLRRPHRNTASVGDKRSIARTRNRPIARRRLCGTFRSIGHVSLHRTSASGRPP